MPKNKGVDKMANFGVTLVQKMLTYVLVCSAFCPSQALNFAHFIHSLPRTMANFGVMIAGQWDNGKTRPTKNPKVSKSQGLIISKDNGTMRQWDDATTRPTNKPRAKRTLPFSFHFSVFTFPFSPPQTKRGPPWRASRGSL